MSDFIIDVLGFDLVYSVTDVISACMPGYYGTECRETCQCQEGKPCNHITGECHCPDGYEGDACDQRKRCIDYYF